MKDTHNWPMLSEMSNSSATIKARTTPPKGHASSCSLPEAKKDVTPSNSETSSISEEGTAQETIQGKPEVNLPDSSSATVSPSIETSIAETKENVNPHDVTKDGNNSATVKRKKPKSE